uniref:Lytic transglycosylase, catalytic n=1 Tax=Solibacter usitatus (strain Ellin6076) TaxID=234267 RepID=Q01WY7_SOLUE
MLWPSRHAFATCGGVILLVIFAACSGGGKPVTRAETKTVEQAPPAPETAPPQGVAHRVTAAANIVTRGPIEQRLVREKWHGDLDRIARRRFLRVLVTPSKLGFHFAGGQMLGAIHEVCREFEKFLSKKLNTGNLSIEAVFIPVSRETLIPMLEDGSGDLVASLVGASERYQESVDYSDPVWDGAKAVIVSGPSAPPIGQLSDLAGQEIYYYRDTIPFDKLGQLSESFKEKGKQPIQLTATDRDLQADDLLEMVNAGLVPMTVAEERVATVFARILPHLLINSGVVVAEGPVRWAIRKNTPQLKAAVNEFIQSHRPGTAYGNMVARRYLRDEKWVKDATARKDLARFEELVSLFRQYGEKYDFPYLLLAAQAYQESRLNPNLRSRAGAVGVMQIKPSTAAASPINISDVIKTDRNVESGAKYLRYMADQYYGNEPMDQVTRGVFAIASYNAGPGMIRKLRAQAADEGYDPNRWSNNVEIIASKRIGHETVQYVGNIYKYYLAYKMITEKDAKRLAARQSAATRAGK